ncbi:MAG: hypothetical protein V7K18_04660 [Nostoc sp.]|uniref:hypothetical protein n=1 Tax=Nostoc sp. TaxID=1180 RepID=UPI002FF76F3D
MANTFSPSQIIDEVKKLKLLSHKGFSDSEPESVAKKMDKVELREKSAIAVQLINLRSLPAGGYAIATDFFRLGRLRFDFFLSLP